MTSKEYLSTAIKEVKLKLGKKLEGKRHTPIMKGCEPELDLSTVLEGGNITYYHELIEQQK